MVCSLRCDLPGSATTDLSKVIDARLAELSPLSDQDAVADVMPTASEPELLAQLDELFALLAQG
jgi:hypothetical protein